MAAAAVVTRARSQALARAREAVARLDRAASRVPCVDLLLYRNARREALRRGDPVIEHAPGVPAAAPAEQPPIAAILRGEEWLAGGRAGGWPGLLQDLHWELMQGCDPAPGALRTAGGFTKGPGRVRVWRRFPDPGSVPSALAAAEAAHAAEDDAVLAAACTYARILLLHPFRNGNGRVIQALVPILLRERGALSRPCLLLGATFDRRRFVALTRADVFEGLVGFALSTIERAATTSADACEAITDRCEADERRLRRPEARGLVRLLSEGALAVGALDPRLAHTLRDLQRAGTAGVVPGLFGERVAFLAGLARIVAGDAGVTYNRNR